MASHLGCDHASIMTLMAGRESEIEVFGKSPDAWFGDSQDLRNIYEAVEEANVPNEAALNKMSGQPTLGGPGAMLV